jgi:tetratricopeptide (TPR) repeat protein
LNPLSRKVGLKTLGVTALTFFLAGSAAGLQRPASAAPAVALSPQLQEVFDQGQQALGAGKLEAAEAAFLKVLTQGGRVAFVYNNLGVVYLQRGENERAVAQFREAIRLQPNYAAPHVLMGSTLLAMGKFLEAARELETAVKLQPQDPLVRLQLAKAYRREEDFPRVIEQFHALQQLEPQEPEYIYQAGKAYLDLSAWCYQQIVRLQPASARAYQALAENFRAQGRPEIAIPIFQRAVQADPTLPEIHLALAEIYFEQGKKAEAGKEIEQELAITPGSAAASALKRKLDTQ